MSYAHKLKYLHISTLTPPGTFPVQQACFHFPTHFTAHMQTPRHRHAHAGNPRPTKRQRQRQQFISVAAEVARAPAAPAGLPIAVWRLTMSFLHTPGQSLKQAHAIVAPIRSVCKAMARPDFTRGVEACIYLEHIPQRNAQRNGFPKWVTTSKLIQLDATGATTAQVEVAIRALPPLYGFSATYGAEAITDASIALLAERGANLHRLTLTDCPALTDTAFRSIAVNCPHLFHLDLGWNEDSAITDKTVGALAHARLDLRYLDVRHCHQFTNKALVAIATFRNLETLVLHGCLQDTLTGASFERVATLQHLTTLDMAHCGQETISDDIVAGILTRCKGLRSLNISHCRQLTDKTFTSVHNVCPNLTTLTMKHCHQDTLTDTTLVAVAKKCPNLSRLNMNGCHQLTITDAGIAHFERNAHLVHLHLTGCNQATLTDEGLNALAAKCPKLTVFAGGRQNRPTAASAVYDAIARLEYLQYLSEARLRADAANGGIIARYYGPT